MQGGGAPCWGSGGGTPSFGWQGGKRCAAAQPPRLILASRSPEHPLARITVPLLPLPAPLRDHGQEGERSMWSRGFVVLWCAMFVAMVGIAMVSPLLPVCPRRARRPRDRRRALLLGPRRLDDAVRPDRRALRRPFRREAVHRRRLPALRARRDGLPRRDELGAGRRFPRALGRRRGRDLPDRARLCRPARPARPGGRLRRRVRGLRGARLRDGAAPRRRDPRLRQLRRRLCDDGAAARRHCARHVPFSAGTPAPRRRWGRGRRGGALDLVARAAALRAGAGGADRAHRGRARLGRGRDLPRRLRDQRGRSRHRKRDLRRRAARAAAR